MTMVPSAPKTRLTQRLCHWPRGLIRRPPARIPATTRVWSLSSALMAGVATGGACAIGPFAPIVLRRVVETQTQPDPLAFYVNSDDLHAHHLPRPHHLMWVGHKVFSHRG